MKIKRVIVCAVVLLLALAAFFAGRALKGGGGTAAEGDESALASARKIADAGRRPSAASKAAVRKAKPQLNLAGDDDADSNRTPDEKKLAEDVEKALDEEDFELAKKCAPLALNCKDKEVRQSMVDTLGWFGEKALPELTPFLADPDEDIAESAMNEWDSAVSSIEDDGAKIGVTEMAMQVISDEDALESISGNYVGVDEKLAIESLLRVIEGGGSAKGIEKAKETYEFVTGDEFTDRAAAEKWIAEEYEPPDAD